MWCFETKTESDQLGFRFPFMVLENSLKYHLTGHFFCAVCYRSLKRTVWPRGLWSKLVYKEYAASCLNCYLLRVGWYWYHILESLKLGFPWSIWKTWYRPTVSVCCYWKLDYYIMQFQEFDWLSGHSMWAIILRPRNLIVVIKLSSGHSCKVKSARSSNIAWLFLMKQLSHLHLLDMRWS